MIRWCFIAAVNARAAMKLVPNKLPAAGGEAGGDVAKTWISRAANRTVALHHRPARRRRGRRHCHRRAIRFFFFFFMYLAQTYCWRWTWGSKKGGEGMQTSRVDDLARPRGRRCRCRQLGDRAIADDDVVGSVDSGHGVEHRRLAQDKRSAQLAAARMSSCSASVIPRLSAPRSRRLPTGVSRSPPRSPVPLRAGPSPLARSS